MRSGGQNKVILCSLTFMSNKYSCRIRETVFSYQQGESFSMKEHDKQGKGGWGDI